MLDGDKALVLARLVVEAERRVVVDPQAVRSLLHQMIAILSKQIERLEGEPRCGRLTPWQVRRALGFIEDNIGRNFHVGEVAAAVRLSPSYFSYAFKDTFGRSAKAYVLHRRIEHAKHMMIGSRLNLTEIAKTCGFADQAHFSRTFVQQVGQAPSRWRRAFQGPRDSH